MKMIDPFVAEFTHESATTRKLLAVIPERDLGWNPHPRSMTFGQLAGHLADVPTYIAATFSTTEMNFEPGDFKPKLYASIADLLATFDANTAAGAKILAAVPDEALGVTWTLKFSGKPLFSLPRAAVLRSMIFNHAIHHRGQLSVYLRLRNVPLPEIYGPTADSK